MRILFSLFFILFIIGNHLYAQQTSILGGTMTASEAKMHAPVSLGPQYLFTYTRTRFEPDTAYSLKSGDWLATISYVQTNSFVYSKNNDKYVNGINGDANVFYSDPERIYSVYIDTETTERIIRLNYGLSDALELQLAYRDLALVPGSLDLTIEDFHDRINVGNQGRENAETSALGIYVWDNEADKMVFSRSQTAEEFNALAVTVGFKYTLRETDSEALAVKFISSFNDEYAEDGMNEATSDTEYSHKNFDDHNISINYTSKFQYFTLHAAYSATFMDTPFFEKGPTQVKHYFLGVNAHLTENIDLIVQDLEYTSVFPKDGSGIGDSVNEITAAVRNFIGDSFFFEAGFVENYTQGPGNIDISFFATVAGRF